MSSSRDRTPGFRLLQVEDRCLVPEGEESAIAFCVRTPREAHGFKLWTRHGYRQVSQETFMAYYEPQSCTISVPEGVQRAVLEAWEGEGDVSAVLARVTPPRAAWARSNGQSPAPAGEGASHA